MDMEDIINRLREYISEQMENGTEEPFIFENDIKIPFKFIFAFMDSYEQLSDENIYLQTQIEILKDTLRLWVDNTIGGVDKLK